MLARTELLQLKFPYRTGRKCSMRFLAHRFSWSASGWPAGVMHCLESEMKPTAIMGNIVHANASPLATLQPQGAVGVLAAQIPPVSGHECEHLLVGQFSAAL
jgi:hypothetical protein